MAHGVRVDANRRGGMEGLGVEAEDPAVIRDVVPVRGERQVDLAAEQGDAGPLGMFLGVEPHLGAVAALALALDRGAADDIGEVVAGAVADHHGRAGLVRTVADVEGVESVDVVGHARAHLLGLRGEVKCARREVNRGCRGDPDLGGDIRVRGQVSERDRGHVRRSDEAPGPEFDPGRGVDRDRTVVLGDHEDDVVGPRVRAFP